MFLAEFTCCVQMGCSFFNSRWSRDRWGIGCLKINFIIYQTGCCSTKGSEEIDFFNIYFRMNLSETCSLLLSVWKGHSGWKVLSLQGQEAVGERTWWPLEAREDNSVFLEQHKRLAEESALTCSWHSYLVPVQACGAAVASCLSQSCILVPAFTCKGLTWSVPAASLLSPSSPSLLVCQVRCVVDAAQVWLP